MRDDLLHPGEFVCTFACYEIAVMLRPVLGELVQCDRFVAQALGQLVPQFFGQEGHERMKKPQRAIERGKQVLPCHPRPLAVGVLQFRFYPLDVPVAKIAPEELVNDLCGLVKPIVRKRSVHHTRCRHEPSEEPLIG